MFLTEKHQTQKEYYEGEHSDETIEGSGQKLLQLLYKFSTLPYIKTSGTSLSAYLCSSSTPCCPLSRLIIAPLSRIAGCFSMSCTARSPHYSRKMSSSRLTILCCLNPHKSLLHAALSMAINCPLSKLISQKSVQNISTQAANRPLYPKSDQVQAAAQPTKRNSCCSDIN